MGLASLWVSDRMLLPTKPKDTFDGESWPDIFATVYDPLEMLTWVAARTRNVKLGTRVLSGLFQNPVTLGRRFATLDRLSGGRAIAGIGQGDFRDEFEAANVPRKRRGRGFEEFVLALRAVWGPDPVRFSGMFYKIPESRVGPNQYNRAGFHCCSVPSNPNRWRGRRGSRTGSCQLRGEARRWKSWVSSSMVSGTWSDERVGILKR